MVVWVQLCTCRRQNGSTTIVLLAAMVPIDVADSALISVAFPTPLSMQKAGGCNTTCGEQHALDQLETA